MTLRIQPSAVHPLFRIAATRRLEEAAARALPPHALMDRAGAATARLACALAPHARQFRIVCGPGHNGGDGFEAAASLRRIGRTVSVGFSGDPGRLPAGARRAFDRAVAAGVPFSAQSPEDLSPQDLLGDALLGIGSDSATDRAVAPWLQSGLAELERAPCPVLAVDTPSGLAADTGRLPAAFARAHAPRTARHTLSLLTLKPGLFTAQGRDAAGTVWFDGLDLSEDIRLQEAADAWLTGLPVDQVRRHASHKGSFGDVAVLGGEGLGRRGMGMTGAALLAATAALHAGAGRVLVALLDDGDRMGVDPGRPELMLRTPQALDLRQATVVCGCGGGEAVRQHLPRVLHEAPRLVLDADALNAVAADSGLRRQLRSRADRGLATQLTPHPLEAARLLDTDTEAVQADRLQAADALARRYGCAVALKGSGTVISAPGITPALNPTGNGRLATAGTGDVLAGMAGARLAALQEGASAQQVFDALRDTVYLHGALADHWPAATPLTALGLARQHLGG